MQLLRQRVTDSLTREQCLLDKLQSSFSKIVEKDHEICELQQQLLEEVSNGRQLQRSLSLRDLHIKSLHRLLLEHGVCELQIQKCFPRFPKTSTTAFSDDAESEPEATPTKAAAATACAATSAAAEAETASTVDTLPPQLAWANAKQTPKPIPEQLRGLLRAREGAGANPMSRSATAMVGPRDFAPLHPTTPRTSQAIWETKSPHSIHLSTLRQCGFHANTGMKASQSPATPLVLHRELREHSAVSTGPRTLQVMTFKTEFLPYRTNSCDALPPMGEFLPYKANTCDALPPMGTNTASTQYAARHRSQHV